MSPHSKLESYNQSIQHVLRLISLPNSEAYYRQNRRSFTSSYPPSSTLSEPFPVPSPAARHGVLQQAPSPVPTRTTTTTTQSDPLGPTALPVVHQCSKVSLSTAIPAIDNPIQQPLHGVKDNISQFNSSPSHTLPLSERYAVPVIGSNIALQTSKQAQKTTDVRQSKVGLTDPPSSSKLSIPPENPISPSSFDQIFASIMNTEIGNLDEFINPDFFENDEGHVDCE